MARQARKASVSGVYHVMLRGINRQRIFEDSQDEQKFLELLRLYRKRCGFALYGYCLMGNHVHLLLKEAARPCVITINGVDVETGPGEALKTVFKRVGVSYVLYFNRKYRRTGPLFQDRFRSEPVDTDEYLLMALRYIHLNPVKARLCSKPEEYPLSSFREYLNEGNRRMVDCEAVLNMITLEELKAYTEQPNEDRFLEMSGSEKLPGTDEEAKACMARITGCASASEFQRLEKAERERALRRLYSEGFAIAQISRITGYSRPIVYRAISG